jgi:A/G-specific adenine glycosylase
MPRAALPITPATRTTFGRRLRAWYRIHARDLPWRRTRDPYHILVSELMLQQTQVSRVLDYYGRFLTRYPTLASLATARPKQVRDAWSGLGYYARARNLHKLSRQLTRADQNLPDDPAELRTLPGIGPYTAGAVASFAFERRAALVDTNVARVLLRVFAPGKHPKTNHKLAWQIAKAVLPKTGRTAYTHNQALMELGALVCTARVHHCTRCPLRALCQTAARTPARTAARSGRATPARS